MSKKRLKDYEEGLVERLKGIEFAAEYLNAALEDSGKGSESRFLVALGHVAKAHGMTMVSKRTGMARQVMYRALSKSGNPELTTLKSLLDAIGLRLAVERKKAS